MPDERPTLLITGAGGGLAEVVTEMLLGDYRLVGADPRPLPFRRNFPGEFHQVDYNHRKMAEIFRQNRFHALLHLGRVRPEVSASSNWRYTQNVLGTRHLLELCLKHGVKSAIVFSTFHVYGAHPSNGLHLAEDAPLRASQTFPELADAIEMDHAASTFLWRDRAVRTVILRPVNVVGPRIKNTITQLLRSGLCPKILGYDPLMQFLHERDAARALKLALDGDQAGIYNVAGEGVVPYSKAIELAGGRAVSLPRGAALALVSLLSRLRMTFPKHLIDYYMYPVVVADAAFRRDFGFESQVTTVDALASVGRQTT